jgi:Beta/Gamma crystallin/CVNH domain
MRRVLSLICGLGLCVITAAVAADNPYGPNNWDNNNYNDSYGEDQAVPDGSYLNSCRNARVEQFYQGQKELLVARCRDNNDRYVSTQLEYRECRGDIYNRNGQLNCDRGRGGRDVPFGSYLNSCRGAEVRGRTLYAECRTRGGFYVPAMIAYRFCQGDISNNNGRLNCRTQGQGDWYPEGGRITLFDGTDYHGRSVTLDHDYSNLANIFNDAASSVRVYEGVWLACKDKNYQGGCIQIDRNWRALPPGANNSISSVRRIR